MEYKDVQTILKDQRICCFVQESFRDSMSSIGFSSELITEFVDHIAELDITTFVERHRDELQKIELCHYGDILVPNFFTQYILPEIAQEGKFLDLGCGRGTLIKLVQERDHQQSIIGIDVVSAPEWAELTDARTRFIIADKSEYLSIFKKEKPATVTATMVLHHLTYDEQETYLQSIYEALPDGARMVLIEDSYSSIIQPEQGMSRHQELMAFSPEDRFKIMGLYDWFANRVFCMRLNTPVPFAYRTIEDWELVAQKAGFSHVKSRFIGYPDQFDVNTPRALLVFEKRK